MYATQSHEVTVDGILCETPQVLVEISIEGYVNSPPQPTFHSPLRKGLTAQLTLYLC